MYLWGLGISSADSTQENIEATVKLMTRITNILLQCALAVGRRHTFAVFLHLFFFNKNCMPICGTKGVLEMSHAT